MYIRVDEFSARRAADGTISVDFCFENTYFETYQSVVLEFYPYYRAGDDNLYTRSYVRCLGPIKPHTKFRGSFTTEWKDFTMPAVRLYEVFLCYDDTRANEIYHERMEQCGLGGIIARIY